MRISTKYELVAASFNVACSHCGEGECSEYMNYENRTQFVEMIERHGWRYRKAGWICGDCRKEEKHSASVARGSE